MAITAVCATILPRLPGFKKLGVSKLIEAASTMRISKGPMLRSLRPSDTGEIEAEAHPVLGRLEAISACSFMTNAPAAYLTACMYLIEKKPTLKSGQTVFYRLAYKSERSWFG